MNTFKSLVIAAAAALAVSMPLAAKADIGLCLDDGAGGLAAMCITDGGAGDLASQTGLITFWGSYGTFNINVSTAVGEPFYLNGYGMDLNSINVGSGKLVLSMTQTGMSFGSGGGININGEIGGVTGGTIGYQMFADDSNAAYGQGTLLFAGSSNGGAFSGSGGGSLQSTDGTFSLTSIVTIVHPANGANTSFNFESKVPEPATLALFGLGLLGLAGVSRRKGAAR